MSQARFPATITIEGRGQVDVEVLAGWDRRLGEYFMSVSESDPPEGADDIIWSTLDHPDRGDLFGIDRLRLQLQRLGIKDDAMPRTFWDTVDLSGRRGEGNVIYLFKLEDGVWKMNRQAFL